MSASATQGGHNNCMTVNPASGLQYVNKVYFVIFLWSYLAAWLGLGPTA